MVPRPCHYLASPLDACGPGSVPEGGLGAGLACGGGLVLEPDTLPRACFPGPPLPPQALAPPWEQCPSAGVERGCCRLPGARSFQ